MPPRDAVIGFITFIASMMSSVSPAATFAPVEMKGAAPGSAGKPPWATVVKVYGEADAEVPPGETGRIFVGNTLLFEGYTGGGHKDVVEGLMATGDVGRFDEQGRLYVEGRDDEMIVSGGENVYPLEVEETLGAHPAVREVAVVGVDDEKFGQRLAAYVVTEPGQDATAEDLKAHVKSQLAGYKVPRDVTFLDELPRNDSGKVMKRDLLHSRGH